MAEKGIIVDDASSGESVACRDAVQNDDDANARVIQLVDQASRSVVYHKGTALRAAVASSDALDIDPIPAGMAGGILDVSDAATVVMWAVVSIGSTTPTTMKIFVTPVICSEDATPAAVCCLPTIELQTTYPKSTAESTDHSEALKIAQYEFVSLVRAFPTYGAKNIAFNIQIVDGTATEISLYAAPSSGQFRDTISEAEAYESASVFSTKFVLAQP